MTDQERQKLRDKLAKWVGWHEEKYEITRGAFAPVLLAPNEELDEGHIGYIPDHTPDFPSSFDACLEWLVPKLLGHLKKKYPDGIDWRHFAVKIFHRWASEVLDGKDPALTFCLAAEKLIDGG